MSSRRSFSDILFHLKIMWRFRPKPSWAVSFLASIFYSQITRFVSYFGTKRELRPQTMSKRLVQAATALLELPTDQITVTAVARALDCGRTQAWRYRKVILAAMERRPRLLRPADFPVRGRRRKDTKAVRGLVGATYFQVKDSLSERPPHWGINTNRKYRLPLPSFAQVFRQLQHQGFKQSSSSARRILGSLSLKCERPSRTRLPKNHARTLPEKI